MKMPDSMSGDQFAQLAVECWRKDGDGWEEVDRIEREEPESLPAVIRALVNTAPDGAISYIGVQVLEDLAEHSRAEARDDPAMDVLIAAQLSPADTFEILAGPYPEHLDQWRIRERFATVFSPAQFDALEDWPARSNRRLMMDGLSYRLSDLSSWFDSPS
jgi:hypothetical protein